MMAISSLNENGQTISLERQTPAPEQKRKTPKTGILVFCLFIFCLAGGILYFMFAPELCPVLYRIPENVISAPAGGEIRHIRPDGPAVKGDVIVELLIPSDAGGAFLEQTYLLRDRMLRMDEEESVRKDRTEETARTLESLKNQLALNENEAKLALRAKKQKDEFAAARKKQLETAERLFELDAVRHSELIFAKDEFSVAEGDAASAAILAEGALLRIGLLKKQIAAEEENLKSQRQSLAMLRERNDVPRKQLAEQLTRMEFVPEGILLKLRAGIGGVVCGTGFREGARVSAGEALARIYPGNGGALEVFVPEKHASDLTGKSVFRVRIGGQKFDASPETVSPYLETVPNPLKNAVRNSSAQYRKAVLSVPENAEGLLNGQTGRAVLR